MEQNKIIEKLESIEKLLHEQNVMKKEVMTVEEAIKYLGISLSQIYKLTSTRSIPCYKPTGRKVYFKKDELDAWRLRNRHVSLDEIEKEAEDYILRNPRRF
ncbi:MAG: helix-turn-helix domain-containing protein [Candidatus Cloacimonetes bacterium]|jgi:excisionase family DNA binding protein|nr:helix-turn-helix domain-containing protein [Bacteroidota bacterium]MBT4726883.1 helix-turn-helix domain-containing protein [Bacteroidota bacterium]MBT5420688.1 helix-turn-helix domain-containing protein [Candidatus Cloacimonadota bacterium]MBT7995971.1 helix-turn-helix domain-containing protein [Bacteroidota bacterium]